MTTASFIVKNALRNKRRAMLSILSVAVSVFLLVTLQVALRELTVPLEDIGAALRVVVRSRISIANTLPARQRTIIEAIPGVEAVSPFTWYGGEYKDEGALSFAQLAIDPKLLPVLFGEAKMPAEQFEAFQKDNRSCILGQLTAEKYHLKVGDHLTLPSTIYPCSMDFTIAGIYSGTIDDRNMLFHHKYLDDALDDWGEVGMWWVKVRSAQDMPGVVSGIDKAFANSSSEVRAESERAFQLSFMSMWGNLKMLVGLVCTVVIFALILVSASTMSMAIRERFQELAVLKAIGFRRRELFGFILAESFGLAMAGTILGAGGAYLLYTYGNIPKMTNGIFIVFEVTPRIMGVAFAVGAGLGILSSILPFLSVARTSVVTGLKTLD